jgi:hypothetical protein
MKVKVKMGLYKVSLGEFSDGEESGLEERLTLMNRLELVAVLEHLVGALVVEVEKDRGGMCRNWKCRSLLQIVVRWRGKHRRGWWLLKVWQSG